MIWKRVSTLFCLLALATLPALALTPQQEGDAKDDAAVSGFSLPDLDGKEHSLSDHDGKIVVVEWTNKDCPYVVRHYKAGTMQKLAKEYAEKDVVWLSIDSTKTARPERLKAWVKQMDVAYPLLLDSDGSVARAWGAKTSPHMFVVKDGKKLYDGAIDDARDGGEATINYVRAALDAVIAGEEVENPKTVPYGCSLKLAPEKKTGEATELGVWITDYEKALKIAKKTGKPILIDFTGSDWCGYCIKLKNEVFEKDAFRTWAKKNAVLLEIDFPRRKQLDEELKKQNDALQKKFAIEGYPTIVYLDGKGRELGRQGYAEGGAEAWVAAAEAILEKSR